MRWVPVALSINNTVTHSVSQGCTTPCVAWIHHNGSVTDPFFALPTNLSIITSVNTVIKSCHAQLSSVYSKKIHPIPVANTESPNSLFFFFSLYIFIYIFKKYENEYILVSLSKKVLRMFTLRMYRYGAIGKYERKQWRKTEKKKRYPTHFLLCTTLNVWEIFFYLKTKINSVKALKIGKLSNLGAKSEPTFR